MCSRSLLGLIWLHLTHFGYPLFQLHIVRILLMVPIYATQSFVAYQFPSIALYLDVIRDCYEAYVLHTFLCLLINYLGGEDAIVLHFDAKAQLRHPWPIGRILRPIFCNRHFFWKLKRGVAQFIIVKPLTAVASVFLDYAHVYDGGKIEWKKAYIYVAALNNLSTGIAMYTLVLFYLSTREKLAPFRPLSKFLCIKTVIFFSFWQSYFLAWAVHLHLLGVGQNSDERTAALVLQDLLICIELPWLAVAHNFAFSYKDFDIGDLPLQPLLSGLTTALYVDDLLKDAHESFFKPVVSKEFVMQTVEEKTTQRRKDRSDLDQGDFIVHNE